MGGIAEARRDALWVTLQIGGPLLILLLIVGLVVADFQALTQVNEASLSFLPKMAALAIALVLLTPENPDCIGRIVETSTARENILGIHVLSLVCMTNRNEGNVLHCKMWSDHAKETLECFCTSHICHRLLIQSILNFFL